MNPNLILRTEAWVTALVLFTLMVLATLAGNILGKSVRNKKEFEKNITETSELAGLLFFILAFTFGMSGNRYDARRTIVVEESNYIGTALLRSDLYPDTTRELFRKDFKDYVEARISYYEAKADLRLILKADSLSQTISYKLWKRASNLAKNPANFVASAQMIPALNSMIDISVSRLAGEKAIVPQSILIMLCFLTLITAFYNGYSEGRQDKIDWVVQVGFCALVALVIFFTLDLDRSRRGLVNLDVPNQTIIELRKQFK
jgi:hypothetical protein